MEIHGKMSINKKGIMLISIVMLSVLLVMLTTSMIFISSENLDLMGGQAIRTRAIMSAEAGVDYAFNQLNKDPFWSPALNSPEVINNEQHFEFIFAKNNLMGTTPDGTTPAYCYEIICRGFYKDFNKDVRAIFSREELVCYSMLSEGQTVIYARDLYTTYVGNSINPGRVHSNSSFFGYAEEFAPGYYSNLDFNGGLISVVDLVSLSPDYSTLNKFKDKNDKIVPVRVPTIDVNEIVDNRPGGCKVISGHTFYIVGYFEYDPNAAVPYCIPHIASERWYTPTDTVVYDSLFKMGIIKVQNETSYINFMKNLRDFYSYPLDSARNLYNYYPVSDVDFWEFDPNTNSEFPIFPDLDVEVTVTPDPLGTCENIITLTSRENLYLAPDSTLGIVVYGGIHHRVLMDTVVKWDLNNYRIYSDTNGKLWLGLPMENSGSIVSKETIDFYNCHEANLTVLSEKNVHMIETKRRDLLSHTNEFNGILYGKDNVLIETESSSLRVNFNGAIISRDTDPDNMELSPMVHFRETPPYYYHPDQCSSCIRVATGELNYTSDGMEKIVSLRGTNFKVRKHFYEIIR